MISKFLKEQKRYTQSDLCEILECPEEKIVALIRKLKEYGIVKAVKASDKQQFLSEIVDEDIEVSDVVENSRECFYVFTFVGVIVLFGRVLKCYPKYLRNKNEPKQELCQILKVLEKYNSKTQIINMFNYGEESKSFNLLAILIFLLQDYYENGTYYNTKEIIETNGSGEIFWDKTIDETFAVLSHNRPYYVNLQTRRKITNDTDYFKRLHECVLTISSKELNNADLIDLFELTEVKLSDAELEEFGDKEYILYRLQKELNVQFNTHKQLVLKTLYAYVEHNGSLINEANLSIFGTNSFNLVWEKVCADIMDNKLKSEIGNLNLPMPVNNRPESEKMLQDIIEKPFWSITNCCASDTLIPDIVSIQNINGHRQFIIFDAKYYAPIFQLDKKPINQPGIESVTKQYLYQLAYEPFIKKYTFDSVANCFLLPTENDEVIDCGIVSMNMLKEFKLKDIQVRQIPAKQAFELYLNGRKWDVKTLHII